MKFSTARSGEYHFVYPRCDFYKISVREAFRDGSSRASYFPRLPGNPLANIAVTA